MHIEVGQRAVDAALRALTLHVGPLGEVDMSPSGECVFHRALAKAAETPKLENRYKDIVVVELRLDLGRPLADFASTLAAASGMRQREEPKRSVSTPRIIPLARIAGDKRVSPLLRCALPTEVAVHGAAPRGSASWRKDADWGACVEAVAPALRLVVGWGGRRVCGKSEGWMPG